MLKIKHIGYLLLSAFLLPNCKPKEPVQNNSIRLIETSIKCQDRLFPLENNLIKGELIVFFNTKSCPSCILDISKYIKVINRKSFVDVKFYTDIKEKNSLDELEVKVEIIKVNSFFANLDNPIIFQTDDKGRIFNCLTIDPSYLPLSFEYINNYASNHYLSPR